jgi:hypothetical protein
VDAGSTRLDEVDVRIPRRKRSRLERALPWVAGLVLVAGVIAAIVAFAPNRNPTPEKTSGPAQVPVVPTKAPLSADAQQVAKLFVQTAVARKNLATSFDLVSPSLRGGLTRAEWLTGDIPVIPYPIDRLKVAPFKIDYAYKDEALLEIALIPKDGAGVKPQLFYLTLKRTGAKGHERWVVDNWVPKGSALVPQGN